MIPYDPDEFTARPCLPRSLSERLTLGLVALPFAFFSGCGAVIVLFTPMPPLGILFTWILIVTQELLVASAIAASLIVIWAVAMPRWVEWLFLKACEKLAFAILFATLPLAVLMVLACFGIKLGAGIGP